MRLVKRVASKAGSPSVLWVAYIVLGLYCLPLFGLMLAALVSHGFEERSTTVTFANIVSQAFLRGTRETFGSIIVPLLTAFAVKPIGPDDRLPGRTFGIFVVLAVLFTLSVSTYGFVETRRDLIAQYSTDTVNAADTVSVLAQTYTKEMLTYIALTLGISVKKPDPK